MYMSNAIFKKRKALLKDIFENVDFSSLGRFVMEIFRMTEWRTHINFYSLILYLVMINTRGETLTAR